MVIYHKDTLLNTSCSCGVLAFVMCNGCNFRLGILMLVYYPPILNNHFGVVDYKFMRFDYANYGMDSHKQTNAHNLGNVTHACHYRHEQN